MVIHYEPKGVCSRHMEIDVDGGIVRSVQVDGGCSGNSQGLQQLLRGMPVSEVVVRLEGIKCGFKKTSCPDQLAKALKSLEK